MRWRMTRSGIGDFGIFLVLDLDPENFGIFGERRQKS